jgi:hypothetical protein
MVLYFLFTENNFEKNRNTTKRLQIPTNKIIISHYYSGLKLSKQCKNHYPLTGYFVTPVV